MDVEVRHAENVDRLVAELAKPGNVPFEALFKALDAAADEPWWPRDADYAAWALHQAALVATPARRNRLLAHAAERAEQFARWATCTAEHDARMHHVIEILADRVVVSR